jgi:hypothetical protein
MSLDVLMATFPVLDQWHQRLASEFRPIPGSVLALDDEDWPPVPLSQIAIMGLGSARDHLKAIRVTIEAGQMLPYAHLTLARAGLLGAAQAVWVLVPDDPLTRQRRARCVAAEMYVQHGNFLTVLNDLAQGRHEGTADVLDFVRQRTGEMDSRRSAAGERARLQATHMITGASAAAFPGHELAAEMEVIWRRTSGAAHGFAWSLMGESDTVQTGPEDEHGRAVFEAAGGINRIANSYMAAYHLATRGWELLDRRNRVPSSV